MVFLQWLTDHGLDLLQAGGLIAGLMFTGLSFRRDHQSRQLGNLLAITTNHREIWSGLLDRPELKRILEPRVDLQKAPITREESLFVTFLILHLHTSFRAQKSGLFAVAEALTDDIRTFFSLPIPKQIWIKNRQLQDKDFVRFVQDCLAEPRKRERCG